MVIKEGRRKYEVRVRNRCKLCGRPRGYMRRFGLCRICFRQEALQGKLRTRTSYFRRPSLMTIDFFATAIPFIA